MERRTRWATLIGLALGYLFYAVFIDGRGSVKVAVNYQEILTQEVEDVYDFGRVLKTYLEARKTGKSLEEVAEKVFTVDLTNTDHEHPHSYPFLSGDTLRAFSDHYFNVTVEQKLVFYRNNWRKFPSKTPIKNGDVIFLKADDVELFSTEILPKIKTKFILITHNSDWSRPTQPKSTAMLDDPRLIRWFAQNVAFHHPKLASIPIGLENRFWGNSGDIEIMEPLLKKPVPMYDSDLRNTDRSISVYVNFGPSHHELRPVALKSFEDVGYKEKERIDRITFWERIKDSKFVLSPPGNGEDCHRTWESILFGAIPIVRNSTLWPLFNDAPVYVLEDWENVTEEQFLEYKVSTKSRKLLLAQYWFDIINSYRDK